MFWNKILDYTRKELQKQFLFLPYGSMVFLTNEAAMFSILLSKCTSKYGVISGPYFPVFGLKTIRFSHFVIKIFALYKNFCILMKMHISITADITHFFKYWKKIHQFRGKQCSPKKEERKMHCSYCGFKSL